LKDGKTGVGLRIWGRMPCTFFTMSSWYTDFANAGSITELSLMVPIVNTLAFLFTVLGEWWVERKVIGRGKCPKFLL
jgi:hypothetical protein